MRQSTSSSAAPVAQSASSSKANNRQTPSKAYLLKCLEVLGARYPALPPQIQSSSPEHPSSSSKRKAESLHDTEPQKRPRPTPTPAAHTARSSAAPPHGQAEAADPIRPPHAPAAPSLDSEFSLSSAPVRRPRRGKQNQHHFEALHARYNAAGRTMKYSSQARAWSTFPTSDPVYRALPSPPPRGSPYHVHGALIARLEGLEALIDFAYAFWAKDYLSNRYTLGNWQSMWEYLKNCKSKWQSDDTVGEKEKALYSIILMIEAFIHGRRAMHAIQSQRGKEMQPLVDSVKARVNEHILTSMYGPTHDPTTPSLPSPANTNGSDSANSTPTNPPASLAKQPIPRVPPPPAMRLMPAQSTRPEEWPSSMPESLMIGSSVQKVPPEILQAAGHAVKTTVPLAIFGVVSDTVHPLNSAGHAMVEAQKSLNLPIMARLFPKTFARMVQSTLSYTEEHEPDLEDEDGELLWPPQVVTGEGIGWVCLMGRAMINEFGKEFGYRGLEGAVKKEQGPPPTINSASTPTVTS